MPYIQLLRVKHIRVAGVSRTYRPGDWVNVGKQTATLWLSDGSATIPGPDPTKMEVIKRLLGPGCGVRILSKGSQPGLSQSFGSCVESLKFSTGPMALPYRYTMLWHPSAQVTPRLVLIGFSQVSDKKGGGLSWEIVARLAGSKLARDVGSDAERARTEALVGDLRIPVYDTGVLWIRKTKRTEELIRQWATSIKLGEDKAHAFLRALYAGGVLLCTLPAA